LQPKLSLGSVSKSIIDTAHCAVTQFDESLSDAQ
jgi:hypothetical protein